MTPRFRDVTEMRQLLSRLRRLSLSSHRSHEQPQIERDEICRDFETFINGFARRDTPPEAGVFLTGTGRDARGRTFRAETRKAVAA